MSQRKKTKEGTRERVSVLNRHWCDTEAIIDTAMNDYLRKEVARDDIVDALVGALTARYLQHWATLPETPEIDKQGLPMEMVYAKL
jgi:predicted RNase H-like nuclease